MKQNLQRCHLKMIENGVDFDEYHPSVQILILTSIFFFDGPKVDPLRDKSSAILKASEYPLMRRRRPKN